MNHGGWDGANARVRPSFDKFIEGCRKGTPFLSVGRVQRKTVVGTMPITLHEASKLPHPSAMFPSMAPWVLFNVWAGSQKSNTS
jgi:hypothetical protein